MMHDVSGGDGYETTAMQMQHEQLAVLLSRCSRVPLSKSTGLASGSESEGSKTQKTKQNLQKGKESSGVLALSTGNDNN